MRELWTHILHQRLHSGLPPSSSPRKLSVTCGLNEVKNRVQGCILRSVHYSGARMRLMHVQMQQKQDTFILILVFWIAELRKQGPEFVLKLEWQ